jgi:hypothetical protein
MPEPPTILVDASHEMVTVISSTVNIKRIMFLNMSAPRRGGSNGTPAPPGCGIMLTGRRIPFCHMGARLQNNVLQGSARKGQRHA